MHIALVHQDIHDITRGGVCRLYRELALQLSQSGHRVTIVTRETPTPWRVVGVEIFHLPYGTAPHEHREAVSQALLQLAPDVAECSSWDYELLHFVRVPRWHRRSAVVVRCEMSAEAMGARDLVLGEAELIKSADGIIAVSKFAAKDIAKHYGIPIPNVVYNGVARQSFRKSQHSRRQEALEVTADRICFSGNKLALLEAQSLTKLEPGFILWVGKPTWMKGWDLFAQTLEALDSALPVVALIGHAPVLVPADEKVFSNVIMLRDVPEELMPRIYHAAKALFSSSRLEGFGLAMAEALSSGTPVVAFADCEMACELSALASGLTCVKNAWEASRVLLDPPRNADLSPELTWEACANKSLSAYLQLPPYESMTNE